MANGEPEAFLERKRRSVARGNSMGISLTDLNMQVKAVERGMWPTTGAREAKSDTANPDGREARGRQMMLCHRARQYPAPKSRDWKGQSQRGIHAPGDALPNMDNGTGQVIGGSLNPQFVSWLMGWPLNWTSMAPLPPDTWAVWQRAFLRDPIS
jgi:hypothetical protein